MRSASVVALTTYRGTNDERPTTVRYELPEATLQESVKHLPRALPAELVGRISAALDDLGAVEGSVAVSPGGRSTNMTEAAEEAHTLFRGKRDEVWTDLIDPELCLSVDGQRWLPVEVDVSHDGVARLSSWLNHLEPRRYAHHQVLADGIAECISISIRPLEALLKLQLCGRRLQFVVGAFEHRIEQPAEGSSSEGPLPFYKISEWHQDGTSDEALVATATCYLTVSDSLSGGHVDFQSQREVWVDDASSLVTVAPASRSLVVFHNSELRHRVGTVAGHGMRRLIALHLVDPRERHEPSADTLPRQLHSQRVRESAAALAVALHVRADFRARGLAISHEVLEYIATLASPVEAESPRKEQRKGGGALSDATPCALSVSQLVERRDRRRKTRLMPALRGRYPGGTTGDQRFAFGTGHYAFGTGTSDLSDDEFIEFA